VSRIRSARPARPPGGAARSAAGAPRRRIALGQNFLNDPALVERVLDHTSVGPEDVVYEIGAGAGAITDRLARRCRHVVAVEKDAGLAERLRRRFAARTNVSVFLADAIEFPLPLTPYKVVANLPFNVTSAVVARLTAAPQPPEDSFLGVQREAAERFAGQPAETLVSLFLKPRFAPQLVYRFERADFNPRPGVDVVLLRLRKRGPPLLSATDEALYRDVVAHAFGAWRPTVRRALGGLLPSPPPGVDLRVTPSALPFDSWLTLFRHFQRTAPADARRRVAGAAGRVAGYRWHGS
jgi:23S rRNA (adenine-N6)-dimethyltransferase